ncbi:hypothetical protein BH24ACT26_BH24ACT26_23470 [soil metagenome]
MTRVVPLVRDVPVRATDRHAPDVSRLHELAARHKLRSSAGRLIQALDRRDRES